MIHDKLKCFGVYNPNEEDQASLINWADANNIIVFSHRKLIDAYLGVNTDGKLYWMSNVIEFDENVITMETFRELAGLSKPEVTQHRVTAPDILNQANAEMSDRAKTYDAPAGERSMAKTVAAFNAIFGKDLTEVEGWQLMAILKIVRSSQGDFRLDNFVDGAAYMGLAGEAASGAEDGGGE